MPLHIEVPAHFPKVNDSDQNIAAEQFLQNPSRLINLGITPALNMPHLSPNRPVQLISGCHDRIDVHMDIKTPEKKCGAVGFVESAE